MLCSTSGNRARLKMGRHSVPARLRNTERTLYMGCHVLTPAIGGSILILGGIGTGIAYIWETNVINGWGATVASTVTYLTPFGGVLLGFLLLGEMVHANQIVDGTIVIFGILVGQGRLRLPRSLTLSNDDKTVSPPQSEETRLRTRRSPQLNE